MGWALANMWFDKYEGLPPPNSPLESLFMILTLRRMEAELLSTRALVHAAMMTPDSKPDPTIKAFQEYADRLLPFLATAQDADKQKERDTLLAFTKQKVQINKKSVYAARRTKIAAIVSAKQHRIRPRMPGL